MISRYNNLIGFMGSINKKYIAFKTKYIKQSIKGRAQSGQRCSGGSTKKSIIDKLNDLLKQLPKMEGEIKYKTSGNSKITGIYDFKGEEIEQKIPDGNKIKIIRIGALQLCCETELILRYYNKINFNKKRWFFSLFGAELNDLEKLKL
jgi:hypothetical protein